MPKIRRRPYLVHLVGPAWMHGGTEQHTLTLDKFMDRSRVRIDCVHVTTPQYFDAASAEETDLTIRQTPPEQLASETAAADCVIHWGIELDKYLAPSRSQARIAIAHGASDWGRAMLDGSRETTDEIVCVSDHVAQTYALERDHLVITNGIDTARLTNTMRRDRTRQQIGANSTAFVVGYMGRLAHDKHIADIITAIDLNQTHTLLLICGQGDEEQRLRQQAQDSRYCHATLTYRQDYIGDVYQSMDCFAMPSEHEGFCLASAEAMWSGLPIIMRRTGLAATDITDGYDGHIYDGTVDNLAAKINLVRQAGGRDSMIGQRAKKVADNRYMGLRMAQQYQHLIETAIEEKPDHEFTRAVPY